MSSRVGKNLIYNISYQLLAFIAPLIITPYVSRVLGPDNIGQYSYSYSIAYYFVIFTMLGLNNYGNRQIAKTKSDKASSSKLFCEIYLMQLCTGIIAIVIYILYAVFISKSIVPWLFLPYVISASLDINWFFFGMERFDLTVFRNSVVKILTIILIFTFIRDRGDFYIYCFIMAMSYFISQVIMWTFLSRFVSPVQVKGKDIIKHFKGNIVLFVPIIAVSLYKIMDKIMLGQMSVLEEVGYYESSEKVIAIPMGIVTAIGTVMLPRISSLSEKNEAEANSYFNPMVWISMFLSSSLCFGMIAISKEFVPLYYGSGFEKCILLYKILLPSTLFLAYSNVIRTQFLIPFEHDIIFITSVIGGAIVNLFLNLFLIPQYASIGAAIATLMAEAFVCIYQSVAVYKLLDQSSSIKNALIQIFNGIVMYVLVYNIRLDSVISTIFIKIVVGSVIYIMLVILEYHGLIYNVIKKYFRKHS